MTTDARLQRAIDRHNRSEALHQGLGAAAAAQATGIIIRSGTPDVLRRLVAAGYRYAPRRRGATTPAPPAPPRMRTWLDLAESRHPPDPLATYGAPAQPRLPVTEHERAEARRVLGLPRLPWEPLAPRQDL